MPAGPYEELIKRLEIEAGPDHSLDSELWSAFGCQNRQRIDFTSSVDTALTLLPAGFEYSLGSEVPSESGEARIWKDYHLYHRIATSLPRAICAVALDALSDGHPRGLT